MTDLLKFLALIASLSLPVAFLIALSQGGMA